MIFSKALGGMDGDEVFDEEATLEDFLHNKGGECLKDAVFYVYMDIDATEDDEKLAVELRKGLDMDCLDSCIRQAKVKYIEEGLKEEVASAFIQDIYNALNESFNYDIKLYLGDSTGKDLIDFGDVVEGELSDTVYDNYKQHLGRVVENKEKKYIDFADAKEFTHVYVSVDHRKIKMIDEEGTQNYIDYKAVSKAEFFEIVEKNMFPYMKTYDVVCYDTLELYTSELIDNLENNSELWTQYFKEIVDNFDFKEEDQRKEIEDIPNELMDPMEQITMVAA